MRICLFAKLRDKRDINTIDVDAAAPLADDQPLVDEVN